MFATAVALPRKLSVATIVVPGRRTARSSGTQCGSQSSGFSRNPFAHAEPSRSRLIRPFETLSISKPTLRSSSSISAACAVMRVNLGETGPLSWGVQARRQALRIRHINGMEVRKKRPKGFKE